MLVALAVDESNHKRARNHKTNATVGRMDACLRPRVGIVDLPKEKASPPTSWRARAHINTPRVSATRGGYQLAYQPTLGTVTYEKKGFGHVACVTTVMSSLLQGLPDSPLSRAKHPLRPTGQTHMGTTPRTIAPYHSQAMHHSQGRVDEMELAANTYNRCIHTFAHVSDVLMLHIPTAVPGCATCEHIMCCSVCMYTQWPHEHVANLLILMAAGTGTAHSKQVSIDLPRVLTHHSNTINIAAPHTERSSQQHAHMECW